MDPSTRKPSSAYDSVHSFNIGVDKRVGSLTSGVKTGLIKTFSHPSGCKVAVLTLTSPLWVAAGAVALAAGIAFGALGVIVRGTSEIIERGLKPSSSKVAVETASPKVDIAAETAAAITHRKDTLMARREMLEDAQGIEAEIAKISGRVEDSEVYKLLKKIKDYASPAYADKYHFKINPDSRKFDFDTWGMGHEEASSLRGKVPIKEFLDLLRAELDEIAADLECLEQSIEEDSIEGYQQPISIKSSDYENQGLRSEMEDAHFSKSINRGKGHLSGVFDGHNGAAVAERASELFPAKFEKALQRHHGDVSAAFTSACKEIQKTINKEGLGSKIVHDRRTDEDVVMCQGCTAVVSYIDTQKGLVYTATLGDAEAAIFRKDSDGEAVKAIPLSSLLDWTDPEALAKAKESYERNPRPWEIFGNDTPDTWVKNDTGPKNRKPKGGPDVPRAFGDTPCNDVLSREPLVTVRPFRPGDKLVLSCDGLGNYTSLSERAKLAGEATAAELPKKLFQAAVSKMIKGNSDNVTIVVIEAAAAA